MALLGMWIYITIAILPLYYQEILGYTAFTAGLVVGPRGIGSFIGSPTIGSPGFAHRPPVSTLRGVSRVWLCAMIFGTVDLDIGPYTLLFPITADGLRPELCVCAAGHA